MCLCDRVSVCVCWFFFVCLRVYVSACASGCLELFLRDLQASWTFSDALLKRDESILHESEKRLASLKHLATSWKHPKASWDVIEAWFLEILSHRQAEHSVFYRVR